MNETHAQSQRHTGRRRGFTLIELMIAITVTGLLIFFIGKLFGDISDAVSLGINQGEIAARSNTVSQQLTFDFEKGQILGAGDAASPVPGSPVPGILIIINHELQNVRLKSKHTGSGEVVRNVRSDQLLFIRRVSDDMRPLVGSYADTYDFDSNVQIAAYARIWYGHARHVFGDGSDGLDLGRNAPRRNALHNSDLNIWADEFVLARQALFLRHDPAASYTIAAGAAVRSAVVGGFVDPSLNPNFASSYGGKTPVRLFSGLADVANLNLHSNGPAPAVFGSGQLLDSANPNYIRDAYRLAYADNRLRVNTQIEGGTGSRFDTWRLAQMHPILMQNVSDFIVEFAADIIDNQTGTPTPDGLVDTDGTGALIWYSGYFNAPSPSDYPPYDDNPPPKFASRAFVWRHDAKHPATAYDPLLNPNGFRPWPHLIRILYRLHDDHGVVGEDRDDPGLWFEQILKVPTS